jgi:hypothetical protein
MTTSTEKKPTKTISPEMKLHLAKKSKEMKLIKSLSIFTNTFNVMGNDKGKQNAIKKSLLKYPILESSIVCMAKIFTEEDRYVDLRMECGKKFLKGMSGEITSAQPHVHAIKIGNTEDYATRSHDEQFKALSEALELAEHGDEELVANALLNSIRHPTLLQDFLSCVCHAMTDIVLTTENPSDICKHASSLEQYFQYV